MGQIANLRSKSHRGGQAVLLARDVMVRNVIKVSTEAKVVDVVRLLAEHRIGALPVVNDRNEVVGIVTDGDIVARIRANRPLVIDALASIFIFADTEELPEKVRALLGLPVTEVMTRRVITVTEETDLEMVATIMTERRLKRVPVVRGRTLVGIICRGDIIKALAQFNYPPASDHS